jgi:hypothetical protein
MRDREPAVARRYGQAALQDAGDTMPSLRGLG